MSPSTDPKNLTINFEQSFFFSSTFLPISIEPACKSTNKQNSLNRERN